MELISNDNVPIMGFFFFLLTDEHYHTFRLNEDQLAKHKVRIVNNIKTNITYHYSRISDMQADPPPGRAVRIKKSQGLITESDIRVEQ